MIFISMASENLTTHASFYQLQDCYAPLRPPVLPQSRQRQQPRPGSNHLPVLAGLRQISSRLYVADNLPGTVTGYTHIPAAPSSNLITPARLRRLQSRNIERSNEVDEDRETPPPDSRFPTTLIRNNGNLMSGQSRESSPAELGVLLSFDEPSGDEEEPSSPAILLDREQRRNRAETSSDDEDGSQGTGRSPSRNIPRNRSRSIRWVDTNDPGIDGPPGPNWGRNSVPHTRFFLEKKRHVLSVKFETPM